MSIQDMYQKTRFNVKKLRIAVNNTKQVDITGYLLHVPMQRQIYCTLY
ncbi:hypothetical protein SAMN04488101_103227 [Pedobacter nyackensis]|uniref:Uncharacterized protein n=1 Tax=Pedobacter nyackensis TaxID=475255 RepID=A0A1W2C8Q9_9SPHI|nr:hypothetical protein SAMN04488101_103227 [Pedobacter nyackensis]